ncbi:MAG: peptidoglycan-binding protein, partial [Candidatus Poribacteria bacterium]
MIKVFIKKFCIMLITFIMVLSWVDISSAQNEWDKYYANPVLKIGEDGSWDDKSISKPSVIFRNNEYRMWYTGFDGEHLRIGYATSIDGENWIKHPSNPILDLGSPGSWDSVHVANPTVVFDGIIYKMWYTGSDGKNTRIGYAYSSNGIHWVKYSNNPVVDLGSWGTNKDSDVWSPCVIFDGIEYKMWYTSFDGNIKIGYAYSSDGINWTKYTNSPVLSIGSWGSWDDRGVWSPNVLFDGFKYSMWYTGWNGISTGIGYAESKDGINWIKPSKYPALDLGTTGSWDYHYVNNPSVLLINGKFRMWYSGCTSDELYMIGYAIGATRPDIDISERFHDFDDVPKGKYDDWEFLISNRGNADLLITSITSDNPVFTIFSSNFNNDMKPVSDYVFPVPHSIPPNGSMKFTVRFTRGSEKTYKGNIIIASNDRDESRAYIQLWMGNKIRYVRQIPDSFSAFRNDLSIYMRGNEVRYLQVILAEEGPGVYPESQINSYFDEFTQNAVANFQRKHKITDPIGFVGSETRKKLTELLNKHREETYDRVDVIYDAVMNNYKVFLPENFPPELILAIASQETGPYYNFNNELIESKENGNKNNVGRGIMQITTSEFVGAGNNADDYLVYRCKNLLDKESVYAYYSNTPQGVEANIRDGLYALKTKYDYTVNCKGNKDFGISDEEMRWISTVQRYNTYNKFLFTIDANGDFCNELNWGCMPERLKRSLENVSGCNSLSSAIITVEEKSKRWRITDDQFIYVVKKENGTATVARAGAPTVYLKNIADKLRRLKSPTFFSRLKKDQCEILADKL